MKEYKNVLSEQTLKMFREEVQNKFGEHCWSVSSLFWQKDLLVGIQGQCVATVLSDTLGSKIISDIQQYLPECKEYRIQAYIWNKNAGISLHNDECFKVGATIYMNLNWSINDGGLFIWQPENSNEYKAILPEFNMMVVNDRKEQHMVTPVSAYANELRVTVQIWGLE